MVTSFEDLLGFTANERRVYRHLSKKSDSVAEIARGTSLPRMTAHYILTRFLKRGLVERMKRNKHFYYTSTPRETVTLSFLPATALPENSTFLPISEGVGLSVHRGKKTIYDLYEKISRESAKRRIYTIQTTRSTDYIFSHYNPSELDRIHHIMKTNEVILEDIVEADFFKPIYEKHGKDFPTVIRSFLDRLTVTYAIPSNVLSFSCDLVICQNVVVFIDWWKETAFEIRSSEVVSICRDLFEALKKDTSKVRFAELAKPYIDIEEAPHVANRRQEHEQSEKYKNTRRL